MIFLRKEEIGLLENSREEDAQEGERIDDQDNDRAIKLNFDFMKDVITFSTTHSFKGYEADTIFLLLTNSKRPETEEELIYTGFTRARSNLIILLIDSPRYGVVLKKLFSSARSGGK